MTQTIHLALDGNEANVHNRVGSNIYAFEIIKGLYKLTKERSQIRVSVLLANPPVKDLPKARAGWEYQVVKPSFLWTQLALPIHLFIQQKTYDVFFTPGHYAPRLSPVPYITSVMDLGFLTFPEQFKHKDLVQLKEWTAYSVKQAQKVVAISQATKQDVIKTYHKAPSDVVVAYPDIDSSIHPLPKQQELKILKRLGISAPYILYVGTLQPRKNLVRLIEAFELTYKQLFDSDKTVKISSKYELRSVNPYEDIQLVIAGKVGWLAEEILHKIESSPLKDKIIMTGYIDDVTKNALYQGATTTVLVGLYEGFGIPALEALAHGVIPVVGNASSLPEVVGKAGVLVNPTKTSDISQGLATALLLTAKERAKLRREARKQLESFSWMKSAQVILDTIVQVADQHL